MRSPYQILEHLLATQADITSEEELVLLDAAADLTPGTRVIVTASIPGVPRERAIRAAGYGARRRGDIWAATCPHMDYSYTGPLR